jgi:mannose-6-phosphate isomerase-like protein (cupin superfamily)
MPHPAVTRRAEVVNFDEIAPVPCPCGQARRAFADAADYPGTVHRTDISTDARVHYHKRLTEVYYILECDADARMVLDGEEVPIAAGTCIRIPPLVRHRAIGQMQVLVIVNPKFDPADEWFD